MEKTTHGLKKPTNDDFYDIQDHNYNTDIIEEHLSNNELHVDAKIVASAQESSVLAQINSSDTNITMWGKLKRAISTLISHISLVASSSVLGHIKIGTGLTMSSGTASVKITDSVSTIDSTTSLSATGAKSLNDNKAPNNHASTTTIYGIGTSSNFGHTKLSDIYASNVGTADTGKGASSKALYDAYTVLNNSKAPNNHASTATTFGLGNESNYGHVKLSDDYASSVGPAALGVGASSKALYDAYTEINNKLNGITIITHPDQINMRYPTSIEDIIFAMPRISTAMFSVSPSFPEYQALSPMTLGLLEITNYDERRTKLIFTGTYGRTYIATYHADVGFSGWSQIGRLNPNNILWTTTDLKDNATKTFNYLDYSFLIISIGYYANLYQTQFVPVSYFRYTTTTSRVIMVLGSSIIEIYKASDTTITVKSSSVANNQQVFIWGY